MVETEVIDADIHMFRLSGLDLSYSKSRTGMWPNTKQNAHHDGVNIVLLSALLSLCPVYANHISDGGTAFTRLAHVVGVSWNINGAA